MTSTRAQHSALPVASSSRNERMRDTNQSIEAITQTGLASTVFFAVG